jgi:deazaflavin-dependent oxidoreductase (nitroreductase family)
LLALTTTGAKTGNQHTVQLRPFPAGDNAWLIVASFGGAAKHPAWFVNMAKNPDKVWAEIGSRKLKVRPVSLTGAERDKAWARIIAAAPSYAEYQGQTDREIPIVRLTPEA